MIETQSEIIQEKGLAGGLAQKKWWNIYSLFCVSFRVQTNSEQPEPQLPCLEESISAQNLALILGFWFWSTY